MTNNINIQYYKTKYGEFILGSFEDKLCMVDFRYRTKRETIDNRLKKYFNAIFIEQDDDILKETRKQLQEYFNYERKQFDLKIVTAGSIFQNQVWNALIKIPYGKTCSYLELAINIKNEKAVRAVANANGANCIGIIIPCHRIIGSNGELTGYAGGLPLKKRLLKLEQNLFAI